MNDIEKRKAAQAFANYWKGKGKEDEDDQSYWTQLLENVYGIDESTKYFNAQKKVEVIEFDGEKHKRKIDIYIPSAKVLIEQKGINIDLSKKAHQSGGDMLTPFEQAKRYNDWLGKDAARWIICCNFAEFWIYDMYTPTAPPVIIKLEELPEKYHLMNFLLDTNVKKLIVEQELSFKAGELVGKLYDLMLPQYKNPTAESTLQSLNKFCVRIVFCLYAEDAMLFGPKGSEFHDYLASFLPENRRDALIKLFQILDTKEEERNAYESQKLLDFPYVNGGLFSGNIEIPQLSEEITNLILEDMSEQLDWSHISPTIFGAVFESTLNPETRRSGGMHYTSIRDIHKVIDTLFLDDLQNDFDKIMDNPNLSKPKRKAALETFHDRLAKLYFLDPACGSGNFLTETFLSLRRLENKVIEQLQRGLMVLEFANPVKVSISQFAGIEINDFAVTVARTALWIAESQMIKETEAIVNQTIEFFPLKTDAKIVEGNALRMDWNEIIDHNKLSYIMGNPPFGGAMKTKEKRQDLIDVFPECKKPGEIDYVSGWYIKATRYITGTNIKCALVSTNSICQGQSIELLWKPLIKNFGIHIDFAYTTFKWKTEARNSAAVFCVIVGFSKTIDYNNKKIYTENKVEEVTHINPYLTAQEDFFIEARRKPISNVPIMHMGVMPRDGGHLILSEEEYKQYIKEEPQGQKFIRKFLMGKEFINNIPRYCFWLVDVNPSEILDCPILLKRIDEVRKHRLNSPAEETKAFAETPMLFCQLAQPKENFIAVPSVSTQNRRYIPIDFLSPEIIVGNKLYVIEKSNLYHFGVLTSNIHNAWMRTVAGRLKSDYNYSNTIVYNNFPWPMPTEEQKEKIKKTAQLILETRKKYTDVSLGKMYLKLDLLTDLKKAHQANDRAVMEAYGMWGKVNSESECVAWLFRMYEDLTKEK